MKLAEALALRAEAARRIEQLRSRIVDNARYQEGEEPTEDASRLLAQSAQACTELESLIRQINRTNASAAGRGDDHGRHRPTGRAEAAARHHHRRGGRRRWTSARLE
jgi:hypothetical protein